MSEALLAQAQRKALAGDLRGALADLRRAAAATTDPTDAARARLTMGRLHLMLGQPEQTADILDAVEPTVPATLVPDARRLRAEWAEASGDPAALREALQAWLAVVDGALAVSALRRLAALEKAQDAVEAMRPWLDAAIARAAADPSLHDAWIDAMLERASVELNLHAVAAARADLAAIDARLSAEPSSFRARWTGLMALVAHGEGDAVAALDEAIRARALAVACRDVPSYVSATLLIVGLQQAAGEDVQAYDTLVRARESLRDLLGEDGAGLIQPALSAFEASLGSRLDAVHAAWAAWRRGG